MSLERVPGVSYPVTERQRLEIRKAQHEADAEEQKRKAAEIQPVFSVQAEENRNALAILQVELETVTAGKPDPGFTIPESVAGKRMSLAEAQRFNTESARQFAESTPEFYPSEENKAALLDYLQTQNVAIADEATYRAAFERLRYLGLLEERPAIESEQVESEPTAVILEPVDPEAERLVRLERYGTEIVLTHDGIGYTKKQLDEMDSDTYARVNRIPRFAGVLFPQVRQ